MKFGLLLASMALAAQPAPPVRLEGLYPVANALRMEISIGRGADGQASCTAAVNGEESGSALICATLMGAEGRELMAGMPPDLSMTMDIVMALDGETVPPRTLHDRGDLVYESSARIGIDQAGRIGACHMLGGHFSGQLAGMQGAVDPFPLCDTPGLSSEAVFPATSGGPSARSGVMRLEFYLRHSVTRQTT